MIYVIAIYASCDNFLSNKDNLFFRNKQTVPQNHKMCYSFEDCKAFETWMLNFLRNKGEVRFLPMSDDYDKEIHSLSELDMTPSFPNESWYKWYNMAWPEAMTLEELKEYWYESDSDI